MLFQSTRGIENTGSNIIKEKARRNSRQKNIKSVRGVEKRADIIAKFTNSQL